jgi:hypothetical protein
VGLWVSDAKSKKMNSPTVSGRAISTFRGVPKLKRQLSEAWALWPRVPLRALLDNRRRRFPQCSPGFARGYEAC